MFMAKSPQTTSHTVAPSRSRGGATTIGLAVLLGVLLGGGGLWLYRSLTQPADQSEQIQLAMQNLKGSQQSLQQIQSEFEVLRGQLVLEESTRKGLEKSLLATQTELAQTREQLAFYEQLLPPGPSGSVTVRALDISKRGDLLEYKVLLQRNAPEGKAFSGRLQFQLTGRQDGKTVKIDLSPSSGPDSVLAESSLEQIDPLILNFNQFQRAMGWLALPQGFEPTALTLNVLEGNVIRASRQEKIAQPD
ncbi:hypothetical protein GCM10010096_19950 [Alcaligenes pakistanensis]|uniref:Uncharacterized protein n=2 Tax=Alcaligenes pakistanensis TaxID=1482717 RepID=A0A8H9M7S2_9BURK|nr:hypothetical protein GCM10010096_19950 [Alcaligenes pakistanensis]